MNLQRYETLVHRYQHRIYGFACYLLGDREEAADVAQEVLLRFWKRRADVDEERLLGWLLRVTRNACIDAMRKRGAYRKLVHTDSEALQYVAGDGAMPDAVTESVLFQGHLQRALGQLDEPYRSIVILREIQELKYEEISEALGLPLNTVKVYLHRARKTLRKLLAEVSHREHV